MDSRQCSGQARFGIVRRSQLDPFKSHTIVRVWCIAPAGLLKITEPEMPLQISLNMQNNVKRWNHWSVQSVKGTVYSLLHAFEVQFLSPKTMWILSLKHRRKLGLPLLIQASIVRFLNGSNCDLRVIPNRTCAERSHNSILKSRLWFQTKLNSTQSNYHYHLSYYCESFFQFASFIFLLFSIVFLGVGKMDGPWRVSMDQGSMFCTFPWVAGYSEVAPVQHQNSLWNCCVH